MCRALGERGLKFDIITNADEVEPEYREELAKNDSEYAPVNVTVHSTSAFDNSTHIPQGTGYAERLANAALEVTGTESIDVLDSWYIVPFVIAGVLVKQSTGLPLVAHHAGSDIFRLGRSNSYRLIIASVLKRVDIILAYPNAMGFLQNLGIPPEHLRKNFGAVPTKWFNTSVKPMDFGPISNGRAVFTYIGKFGKGKGVTTMLDAMALAKKKPILILVSQGKGLKDAIAARGLQECTHVMGFVPPWKIPSIIRGSDCMVFPEHDFSIGAHTPIGVRESMACGACTLVSNDLFAKLPYEGFEDGVHSIKFDPRNTVSFAEAIDRLATDTGLRREIGERAAALSQKWERHEFYLQHMEEIYKEAKESTSSNVKKTYIR